MRPTVHSCCLAPKAVAVTVAMAVTVAVTVAVAVTIAVTVAVTVANAVAVAVAFAVAVILSGVGLQRELLHHRHLLSPMTGMLCATLVQNSNQLYLHVMMCRSPSLLVQAVNKAMHALRISSVLVPTV